MYNQEKKHNKRLHLQAIQLYVCVCVCIMRVSNQMKKSFFLNQKFYCLIMLIISSSSYHPLGFFSILRFFVEIVLLPLLTYVFYVFFFCFWCIILDEMQFFFVDRPQGYVGHDETRQQERERERFMVLDSFTTTL